VSAKVAPPAPVLVDVVGLGDLHDKRPLPEPELAPWAPGDLPHGESIDLNEYPVELLKMKVCRSFRADLRHKLTLIIRARGGYGNKGVTGAAERLGVRRQTVYQWLKWLTAPKTRLHLERIDNAYQEAVEQLVAEKLKRRRKHKRDKRATDYAMA
jgi:hypothetical protein